MVVRHPAEQASGDRSRRTATPKTPTGAGPEEALRSVAPAPAAAHRLAGARGIDEVVRRVVDGAPPLSPGQRDRLALLFSTARRRQTRERRRSTAPPGGRGV